VAAVGRGAKDGLSVNMECRAWRVFFISGLAASGIFAPRGPAGVLGLIAVLSILNPIHPTAAINSDACLLVSRFRSWEIRVTDLLTTAEIVLLNAAQLNDWSMRRLALQTEQSEAGKR
jgi:hypothetical protein